MSNNLDSMIGIAQPNTEKKIAKIKEEFLSGFPLVFLNEKHLEIRPPYSFSSISVYERPVGNSNLGSATVSCYSVSGDLVVQKIFFEFKHTENERIEDAKKPESFTLRSDIIFSNKLDNFKKTDFKNKYSDVSINSASFLSSVKNLGERVQIFFSFVDTQNVFDKNNSFSVIIPLDSINIESFVDENNEQKYEHDSKVEINVLKKLPHKYFSLEKKKLSEVQNFEVKQDFLKSVPYKILDTWFIVPKAYINLIKVDFVYPKNSKTLEAEMVVHYELGGEIKLERVQIIFKKNILELVNELLSQESSVSFRYLPKNRTVPPIEISENDFEYTGNLKLKIIGTKYNYKKIDPNNRFVTVILIIKYREVISNIVKRLEFQYSKNEYNSNDWKNNKIENDSIIFDEKFIMPDVFYTKVDNKKWVFIKPIELFQYANISSNYPYSFIKDIKLINFDPSSRILMFKIVAIEYHGKTKISRIFEKHEKMQWSYNEWTLDQISENDLLVDESLLPEYPSQKIDEKIFFKNNKYKILSVQYNYLGDDSKEMEFQVQISIGRRHKIILKKIAFSLTYNEYLAKIKKQNLIEKLYNLKPSDLSILVDLNDKAPEKISTNQVVGIPEGVQTRIIYRPPQNGFTIAKIIILFSIDKIVLGFEQTLSFSKAR